MCVCVCARERDNCVCVFVCLCASACVFMLVCVCRMVKMCAGLTSSACNQTGECIFLSNRCTCVCARMCFIEMTRLFFVLYIYM